MYTFVKVAQSKVRSSHIMISFAKTATISEVLQQMKLSKGGKALTDLFLFIYFLSSQARTLKRMKKGQEFFI